METGPKEPWQLNTERMAAQIREARAASVSEEDLKMRVDPIIREAFQKIGLDVEQAKYEHVTTFRGRIDAYFGFLIVEYEAPGKLGTKPGLRESVEQLQRYMREEAAKAGKDVDSALEKFVGVAIDGDHILFIRFSKSGDWISLPIPVPVQAELPLPGVSPRRQVGFQIVGPHSIDKATLANLLVYARAARRRPLSASALASAFGPGTEVAQQCLSTLYAATRRIERQQAPSRPKKFFKEWDRLFGVVYGQDISKAEKAAGETAKLYGLPGGTDVKPLLFAIHTYYAFLMKLMAVELLALQPETPLEGFLRDLPMLDDPGLFEKLSRLESGGEFNAHGIVNFLEADLFSWYLDLWGPQIARNLREVARVLSDFEAATPRIDPQWTQDLLRNLYETIVPRPLRHGLGEYYTPDWLAGYLLDRLGYKGDLKTRLLDPACGSGTFLIHSIRRALERARKATRMDPAETARRILANIVGFDLNPMAVLAARTNYLIALGELVGTLKEMSLPVYLCDSVVPLERPQPDQPTLFPDNTVVFSTHDRDYVFPLSMKDQKRIDTFTGEVDLAIRGGSDVEGFARRLPQVLEVTENEKAQLVEVYRQIKELHDEKQDGIWARYIKNAFAPE